MEQRLTKRVPKTISVYFEAKLHNQIKRKARAQDMSLSQYMRRLVKTDIEQAAALDRK